MNSLITIAQAAETLGISSRQVYNLIDTGQLPVVSLGKSARGYRIDPDDITALVLRSKKVVTKCPSISGVKSGGVNLKSIEKELEKALGRPVKGKPKNLSVV